MHWLELQKSIEEKKFNGVCLMYGNEEYLKDTVINKASELYVAMGLEDINISRIVSDDLEKIKEAISMPPFMAEKRIVVIDSYKKFYANKNQYKTDDMTNVISELNEILDKEYRDCCIFFLCRGSVDTANPLYKLFNKKGLAVSYGKVTESEKRDVLIRLSKEKKIDINSSVISFLIRYTGGDLLSLENELDKLSSYKKGKIENKDVESICHASADYNVFNMIKAIDAKHEKKAFQILKDMLRGGEYVGGIVSLIERQYRTFAFIEDMQKEFGNNVDFAEMEKRLGVKSFVIEKVYKQGLKMDKEKRNNIIKMCTDADYMAKCGKINDVAALERLVIKLIAE